MKRICLAFLTSILLPLAPISAKDDLPRSITNISGNLYRAQNNRHFTLFLVTARGIVLTDPINREFSLWLKDQLSSRFNVPVTHVLYSHHHYDHASGGEVFADTAQFVGQQSMLKYLALPAADTPLSSESANLDTNKNGTLERVESTGRIQQMFDLYDANGDGSLSGAELVRGPVSDVYPPDVLYESRLMLELGDSQVEMTWVGPITHSDDMSVIRFVQPEQTVLYAVDFIQVRQLPYGTLGANQNRFPEWLESIRAVEQMDFDVIAPGHHEIGSKVDIADFRRYLEVLRDRVASGVKAGATLEEIQKATTMNDFKDWSMYNEWRPDNVTGMYQILTLGD